MNIFLRSSDKPINLDPLPIPHVRIRFNINEPIAFTITIPFLSKALQFLRVSHFLNQVISYGGDVPPKLFPKEI